MTNNEQQLLRIIKNVLDDHSITSPVLIGDLLVMIEDHLTDRVEEQVTLLSVATHIYSACVSNPEFEAHGESINMVGVVADARELIELC